MTVNLNHLHIHNWLDFIDKKFSDKSIYEIEKKESGDYLIKSKTNKTTIWFFLNEDLSLSDCQYYNGDCRGWSGETTAANADWGIFTQENVDAINEVLQTPLTKGWLSVDYYLGESVLQSKTYFDKDKNSRPFVHISEYGCFAFILFPVFWLLIKLVDLGLIGHKKETMVTSILTTN
jgi:hypothetical protein